MVTGDEGEAKRGEGAGGGRKEVVGVGECCWLIGNRGKGEGCCWLGCISGRGGLGVRGWGFRGVHMGESVWWEGSVRGGVER